MLGTPSQEDLAAVQHQDKVRLRKKSQISTYTYMRQMLEFLSTLPPCQPTPLKQYLPDASQNGRTTALVSVFWAASLTLSLLALGLLSRMLVFDPLKRITVVDALAHPFLADLHDKEDEVSAPASASVLRSTSDCS